MAAQLCPRDANGEHFFHEHHIREFTARANVFELRRYMTTLRARNGFLHGLDAFAAQHVPSLRDDTICDLLRKCRSLRVTYSNGSDHEWNTRLSFGLVMTPPTKGDRADVAKAGTYWRGDCRDCGLSNTLAENIAAAELRLVNEEIERVVKQFNATRAAYLRQTHAKTQWIRGNVDGAHVTTQKYEQVIHRMDATLLEQYNRMRAQLCALVRLGIARIGMKYTSLDDFFLDTWVAWGQGCNAAAKEAAASAPLAPRYLCLFAHIADQMRQDRLRFVALQGLRLNLDLPGSKRVKRLAETHAATGAIGA